MRLALVSWTCWMIVATALIPPAAANVDLLNEKICFDSTPPPPRFQTGDCGPGGVTYHIVIYVDTPTGPMQHEASNCASQCMVSKEIYVEPCKSVAMNGGGTAQLYYHAPVTWDDVWLVLGPIVTEQVQAKMPYWPDQCVRMVERYVEETLEPTYPMRS